MKLRPRRPIDAVEDLESCLYDPEFRATSAMVPESQRAPHRLRRPRPSFEMRVEEWLAARRRSLA
jgi:hypothetical protein